MKNKNFVLGSLVLIVGVGLGMLLADAKPANAPTERSLSAHPSAEMHTHAMYEVPKGTPVPSVDLVAVADSKAGWNLNIRTKNFVFTPEHAGEGNIVGEGHAHVYVDGVKVGRAYGNWYYLGDVDSSPHVIEVTLNTNNHEDYAVNKKVVSASVEVGTKNVSTFSEKKDFNIRINENKISSGTSEISVKDGDTVSILITADTDEEFHLHGYDKSVELKKGIPATMTFVANMTGRFSFELEHSGVELGAVSVYPK